MDIEIQPAPSIIMVALIVVSDKGCGIDGPSGMRDTLSRLERHPGSVPSESHSEDFVKSVFEKAARYCPIPVRICASASPRLS